MHGKQIVKGIEFKHLLPFLNAALVSALLRHRLCPTVVLDCELEEKICSHQKAFYSERTTKHFFSLVDMSAI